MYNIYFSDDAFLYIEDYFKKYREYYENLYEDSGIWSEKQIVDGYTKELKNRKNVSKLFSK